MDVTNYLTESYHRTKAIVLIGVIGATMSVLGLLETGRNATGEVIEPTVPMGRTAEGIYTQTPEILTQTTETGMGIPIFGEVLPAFMYGGGIVLLLLAAYLDYTESDQNSNV